MDKLANKLVFVGDMGAGKTTAIRAISDVDPVSTEMPMNEARTDHKGHATVAMDYSSIELGDGELLHLYGIPGQKHPNFMWPLVCDGAFGIIILVDGARDDLVANVDGVLREFSQIAPDAHFAVGVTQTDRMKGFCLPSMRDELALHGHRLPVLRVDVRSAEQVMFLVRVLLACRHAGVAR